MHRNPMKLALLALIAMFGLTGCPENPTRYGWAQIVDADTTDEWLHVRASQSAGLPDLRIKAVATYNIMGFHTVNTLWGGVVKAGAYVVDDYFQDDTPGFGVLKWELYLCMDDDLNDCQRHSIWTP